MNKKLHIDIETYSSIDIRSSGAYKYSESVDFEILLIAYALDDSPIKCIDLAQGESIPEELINWMLDPNIDKWAHNATFERRCFTEVGIPVPIEQWYCSAILAAYCGLPLSLELVSKALNLGEKGKLSTGKALIRYFCIPCKPTKANNLRERNFPKHDLEKWEEFKTYCVNDVEAERQICHKLSKYKIPDSEREIYIIDQEINDNGILIDLNMVDNAVKFDNIYTDSVMNRAKELTGLQNPNSPAQLKKWLGDAIGEEITSLAKENLPLILEKTESEAVVEVIDCRKRLAKSSTKKYVAMQNCICGDGRAHGVFQFYGANRTGRWAGRLIQLQNLPQNHMNNLKEARDLVASGDYGLTTMLYDNIPNVLSELIRTAFVSKKDEVFSVADFSAIEARVLSWVAGEEWRMDVFKTHGKIYEASASMMFGVPIEEVTKGSDLRQKGKTAELALGYQGSVGAMTKMGGEKMGLSEVEMKAIVYKWRKANKYIVKFWNDVNECAIQAIKSRRVVRMKYLEFEYNGEVFTIKLPSGRKLFYQQPKLELNRFGNMSIKFRGMDQIIKQWVWIETYGGKLTENIVQAISRDLLAYSMVRLKSEGFKMVMHVHDEVAAEVRKTIAEEKLTEMCNIMGEEVPWAPGLPLNADGYITPFYKKD